MNDPRSSDKEQALLHEAQAHLRKGAVINAMQAYYALHEIDPDRTEVLRQLVALNLHLGLRDQAVVNLHKLIVLQPDTSGHYDQLAELFSRAGEYEKASEVCYALLARKPKSAEAHFNLAYYLRKVGRFEAAIESYQRALEHGIERPEEAHLNIAVVLADDLRKEAEAEAQLQQALQLNGEYLPALYNLANLYEDRGEREQTVACFEKILAIKPGHARALARLTSLQDWESVQHPQIARLEEASKSPEATLDEKIDALFALGKAHDDCRAYDQAFHFYRIANELEALKMSPYDRAATERHFGQIVDCVSADWVERHRREAPEQPVFICGMFRSGSTLLEQMLAAHPAVTAGGEIDSFAREFSRPGSDYPSGLANLGAADLSGMAERYLARSRDLFPEARLLTDKRPDNFLYVGLLKALFPAAKIIYTVRQPLDNCLSVYFVRLGRAMNYAMSLDDTAHYYDLQARLLAHWKSVLGEDLHVVDYDSLVSGPRPVLEGVLDYLGLEWHDACLEFHQLKNTVKTASVWQVRRPLYTASSGRWRNYREHLGGLLAHFGGGSEDSAADE